MDAGTIVGLMIAAGVAWAVYNDALERGWESSSAVLMSVGVVLVLIIFLPIYLFIKNNPGSKKVTFAANREISRQTGRGVTEIVINADEIGREVGMRKTEIVRELLYQAITRGEIPRGVKID